MFADYVKMGAKAVALAAGAALIIGFLAGFTIPTPDLWVASNYLNKAYTIGTHYIPMFSVLWVLGVTLITLKLTALGIKFSLIAIRWVLKVNE